jgi:hypothetical protein
LTTRELAAKILRTSPGGTYGVIPLDHLAAAIEERDREWESAHAKVNSEFLRDNLDAEAAWHGIVKYLLRMLEASIGPRMVDDPPPKAEA